MSDPERDWPNSWYAASAGPIVPYPALAGDERCDVCVVGGGITGLATALELAERGFDTVLVESRRIGWGASGRSGGQVIFGYACDMERLEKLVGDADARRLWDMSIDALNMVRGRVGKHRIDCDLVPGMVHTAVKDRQQRELGRLGDSLRTRYRYESLQMLDARELRDHVVSERYVAGLLDSNSFHLHPLKYTLGLAAAATAAGVRIYEHTEANELRAGGRRLVITGNGAIACRSIALCGNAYLGRLTASLHKIVMPVGTYIAATAPLGAEVATALIPSNVAVSDINFVLDYFRLSADRRLLFGGRVSYSGLDPVGLEGTMRKRMARVFPSLRDARVDYVWGGHVAITRNRAPHFGRVAPDVYFAQGFSGHGMALTTQAGSVLAAAIAGDAQRLDVFAKIPHRRFPGGAMLRTPALVLAMAWFRLRDLL